MRNRKRLIALIGLCLPVLLLAGCINALGGDGVGGSDFSTGKFFSNPLVIVAVLALIIFMWKKGK